MTTGFQQQKPSVNFCVPKSAALPQQVGRKLKPQAEAQPSEQRPPEPRSFK